MWQFTVHYKPPSHLAVLSGKFIKKTNFHVDGILGNTFPIHAKWEILIEIVILREKTQLNHLNANEDLQIGSL